MGISNEEFACVWKEHFERLRSIARKYVSHAIAEDVLQDVAMEAVLRDRASGFETSDDFVRWLYKVTKFRAIDEYRANARRIARELSQEVAIPETDTSTQDLFDGIAALPPRQREVINLILGGVKIADIAGKLQISVSAVRTHKHEAFKSLHHSIVKSMS